jgi:predicted AlkP superfamily pyrophosphatase or phosphodiesterase
MYCDSVGMFNYRFSNYSSFLMSIIIFQGLRVFNVDLFQKFTNFSLVNFPQVLSTKKHSIFFRIFRLDIDEFLKR